MAQKSILSFFKSKEKSSCKDFDSENTTVNESPVKKAVKRKRVKQLIESDDETNDTEKLANEPKRNGRHNTSNSHIKAEIDRTDEHDLKQVSEKKPKIANTDAENIKKEIVLVSVDSSSHNGSLENVVRDQNKKISKKNNKDFSVSCSEKVENGAFTADEIENVSSNINKDGSSVEIIPKRKTARKQMKTTRSNKDTFPPKINKNELNKSDSDCLSVNESPKESDNSVSLDEKKLKKETETKSCSASISSRSSPEDSTKEHEETSNVVEIDKKQPKAEEKTSQRSKKQQSVRARKQMKTTRSNKNTVSPKINKNELNKSDSDCLSVNESPKASDNSLSLDEKKLKKETETKSCAVSISSHRSPEDSTKEHEEETSNVLEIDKEQPKTEESTAQRSKKQQSVHGYFEPIKKSSDANPKIEKCKNSSSSSSSKDGVYDPSKSRYHPIDDACWKASEKVPYIALAKTLEVIENTSARLKIIEILSNFLRSVIILTPEDLLHSIYLCLNRLAPEYEGLELGIGETLLMKAVAQATGRTVDKIKAEVAVKGDLGLVAESSRGNQKVMFAPPKLTVSSVFSKFKEIAKMSGNAVMTKKTDKIQLLFVACRDCEAKYIIRSLSGKLRIGLAEQSVLSAIARAVVLTPPGQPYPPKVIDTSSGMSADSFKKMLDAQTLILKTTYCECPNYDLIVPVLLKEGISALPTHCQICPGRPVKPMLAHPTTGIDEVLRRFDNNEFTCEFKYDGERAQIHMTDDGEVKIYSRNQEDNTSKYPDIVARIFKALKEDTKTFILDSEAVAWDKEVKQILPFQVLSTRKKKDAAKSEIVVQVCIMAFDLLFLNGESLVKKPLKERRALLHSCFTEVENEFMFVTHKDGNSAETMQEFLDDSVKGNCEGLMVKSLEKDASYEIAKRSHNWLKLKKDYLEGVGDTLDLVVIGGYHGKGKRTGTYGGFLLACYDDENEEFQSICKLGTGFKEDELEAHTNFLKQHVIKEPKSYFRYDHSLEPDVWFEPVQVWEIKCADLSISPVHKAGVGIVDPEKGISLRFPRFLKIRDDKKPEDATVSSQVAEMYQKQEQVQNLQNKNVKNEEDYY